MARYEVVPMTPSMTGDPETWWAIIDNGGSSHPDRNIMARCDDEARADHIAHIFTIYVS